MDDTTTRVLAHYREALGEAADLRLDFAEKMWRLQDEIAESAQAGDAIDGDTARESLATGQPLFLMAPPQISVPVFVSALERVAALLADEAGIEADVADALREADFASLIKETDLEGVLQNMDAFTDTLAAQLGASEEGPLNPVVVRVVVASALSPLLRARAARILESLEGYDWRSWGSGSCPVCAAPAAMARVLEEGELQGGRRMLWCALCDTEWEFDRLRCARCGQRTPDKLHYLMNSEDPGHRAHVCEECHGYLKTVFERDLQMVTSPRVEDVITLEIDAVARSNGFSPLGDED